MDVAYDKWALDILPVIERSRYRDQLPTQGRGSRGGTFRSIRFKNGATLRFMSGGGGDKSRAAFTARVLVVTETDGLAVASATSKETDKLKQLEARTRAYASRKRVYMECTVTSTDGRTWTEYSAGTKSRIYLACPHCRSWVSPERQHLVGWQDATTAVDAREQSAVYCPECGERWSDDERVAANAEPRLVHRGQDIDGDGKVVGEAPATNTFGLRWTATTNLFVSPGDIGVFRRGVLVDADVARRHE